LKRTVFFATAATAAAATAVWLAVPAGAAPAASSAGTGTEHFQFMTTSTSFSPVRVIVFGVFTTAGRISHTVGNVDTLAFPGGTFKIAHSKGIGSTTVNKKTCLVTTRQRGTYKVFGGTGKYAGISGHGTAHLNILAIAARSRGKCTMTKPPLALQLIVRQSGPVTL
jgi:hypothetical protein